MSLETLAKNHAYCASEVRRLKELGQQEMALCDRFQRAISELKPLPSNCIGECFKEWQANLCPWGDSPGFEDEWKLSVEEGLICEHCQKVREIKKQRVALQRRLGSIRAAITRIGQRLSRETA